MSVSQFLYGLIGVKSSQFLKEEIKLLEMDLFARICIELENAFRDQYKNYLRILRCDKKMEDTFVGKEFIRYIIQDILSTQEYSLVGVACYAQIPEEVIYDILIGKNTDPSASILRKIIELHRSVRPEIYSNIMRKLMTMSQEIVFDWGVN